MLLVGLMGYSKSVIPMEYDNGLYRIPCIINGARVKLIFDTGATVVSLSLPLAEYLYDNDYITDEDIIGFGQSTTADGSMVDHLKFNIKQIIIGDEELTNVEAIVIASQDAPLLLGQSAIQKLGKIELEGNNLIITNGGEISDVEIDALIQKAEEAMDDEDYYSAIKYYRKLYEADALSDYGVRDYAEACRRGKEYKKAIKYYSELEHTPLGKPEGYNAVNAQFNLYCELADCYLQLDSWDYAIINIKKALDLAEQVNCRGTKLTCNKICQTVCYTFANLLWEKEFYEKAADYYYKAMEYWGKDNNMSVKQVWKSCLLKNPPTSVRDNDYILDLASNYAQCQCYSYRWNDEETQNAMIALARNGSNRARYFCNTNRIKY